MNRAMAFAALAVVTPAVGQTPDFYVASTDDLSVYRVDGSTLQPTLVGALAGIPDPACAFRIDGLGTVALVDRISDRLLVLDSCSAAIEGSVALDHDVPNGPRGMDVHPDGTVYGVFAGMELRSVDPLTGETHLKAVISGTAFVEGIAFAPDAACYAVGTAPGSSDSVYSLDIETGVLSLIASVPAFDLDDLTYGPDGFLYSTFASASKVSELYRIDPTDGAFTNLGPIGILQANALVAVHPDADCDGNGQSDECDVALGDGYDLDHDGVLDACEGLGGNYCAATVNSSGKAASIFALGSSVIADNDLLLAGVDVPSDQFGYYLMSTIQDFVPGFGGSDGNLCLGQPITRFNHRPKGQVLFSGADGVMTFRPDLASLPNDIVFQQGDTWSFQLWFRDVAGGNFTSNTTDGLAITWR